MKMNLILWKLLFLICSVGAVGCLCFSGWYVWQLRQAAIDLRNVRQAVEDTQEDEVSLEEIEQSAFSGMREGAAAGIPEGVRDAEHHIDFEKLAQINPDLYAWIRIPGTQIDYPVAQREGDDEYYLNRDLYGKPRFAGCIYTEDENSKDFTDFNTVLYGHNMKNGSMFRELHLFEEADFFAEHEYFFIDTPDGVLVYRIFAAYSSDARHILHSYDYKDQKVRQDYIDEILHVHSVNANLRSDVKLTPEDRIVTLSTCNHGQTDQRYLVQGVLVREE